MPHVVTLPGTRDGPDNIFARQDLFTEATHEVPPGGRVYSSLPIVYWTDHSFASVVNQGRIWNISPGGVGTAIGGWNLNVVENYGLIVSEAPQGNAFAISVASRGAFVNNTGQIFALANGNATAISHWDPYVRIDNSGLIVAYAPTASIAGVGDAVGVAMFNGGLLHNRAGASILAEGLSARAVLFGRGHLNDPGVAEIRNEGVIEAYAIDPANESVAILTAALSVELMRVVNSGIIRAEVAYRSEVELGWSPPQQPADQILNLAGGEIYGLIDTRLGADSLINLGLVRGDLLMGEGADLVDTAGGIFDGKADMGWGDDRFLGEGSDNAVLGGRDRDWLEGGGGNDLLMGGLGDDTLVGCTGNDGLFGEYGEDRIITAGGDTVDAGPGDDSVETGDLSFRSIHGGDGFDRLVLAMGAVSLDAAAVRATGRVTDIEMVEMRGGQRIVIRAGDVLGLSGEDRLHLLTTGSDRVELIGAWTELSAVVANDLIYRRFTLAGEIALVAGGGTVTIAASPSAPAEGLDSIAPGPAAPLPGSVAGVDLSSATTVLDYYTLHATETIQAYEVWRSDTGMPLVQSYDWNYSLINYGLIESLGPGNGGAKALWLSALDRFVNYGTMRAVGPYADTVYALGHTGALINFGLIEAIATAGQASGATVTNSVHDGVNFENHGIISARASGGRAVGASISNDDQAFNLGTISAVGGDGTIGVSAFLERNFTNRGTVTADLAAGASGSTTGLLYMSSPFGSTYVNYGLIHGTRAIAGGVAFGYPPGPTNFYNFGRLEGTVELGDGRSRFENWGVVTGDVRLGAAINLWFGGGGQQAGAVFGGDGADMLIGGAAADRLNGENDDDYLFGGGGADQLSGGAGRDLFVYTAPDQSTAAAFDTISDFVSGADRIDLSALGVQSASIQDGGGFTLVSATNAQGTLTLHVTGAVVQSDLILAPAATVSGTSGVDRLTATAEGNMVSGGGGDDILIGAGGDDRLDGGAGYDVMWGGAGNDVYAVDSSADLVWEVTGQGTDLIEFSSAGDLLVMPDNVENATLLQFGFVRGNQLANTIRGSGGNDALTGGVGNDVIEGGAGNDRLEGGAGGDRMTGGGGADTFVFLLESDSLPYAPRSDGEKLPRLDLITDFTSGTDKISLIDVRYLEGGSALFPDFTFIGTAAFSHHVGEIRYEMNGGYAQIYVDINGDGFADMHIVAVTPSLQATDFIL